MSTFSQNIRPYFQVPLDGQGNFDSVTVQDPAVMYFFMDITMQDVECLKIEATGGNLEGQIVPVTLNVDTISFCYEFGK